MDRRISPWVRSLCLCLLLPAVAGAQQAASIAGRVSGEAGAPLAGANVFLPALGVGTVTRADGGYTLSVPAARLQGGRSVTLTAQRVGYRSSSVTVALSPGTERTQDFTLVVDVLELEGLVATGAGTQTRRARLGTAISQVSGEQLTRAAAPNVVSAIAGKAPGVEITASSGEPGASSYIRMRGIRTLSGSGQPLFVIDGVPIDNSSFSTSNFNPSDELGTGEISGTTQSNRAVDVNPDDIESVEVLKGAAAGAIYGARAGQGVVLITTRKGRPGPTRYTLRVAGSFDDVNRDYPLQRGFGQGRRGLAPGASDCDDPNLNGALCTRSWGPRLGAGTPTFDHANEAYTTGTGLDTDLAVSGGDERTQFYLSTAYLSSDGVFEGSNDTFDRASVRLKASHQLSRMLQAGGNLSYTDSRGRFVQRGNNVNGLQLGLLRTPPDFDNRPYLHPTTGLHRSFRMRNPPAGSESLSRGFDNPFFVLGEVENTSQVGRIIGNVSLRYDPAAWLHLDYTLGADYFADERLEGAPQASSDVSAGGRVTQGKITNYQIDHSLTATAQYRLGSRAEGSLTLGQNLNARDNRILANVGRTLVAPQPFKLSNTVTRDLPYDTAWVVRNESYFGQATLDLWDQLFLTAALRNDGSSTFSADHRRSWFPKASAAWSFTELMGERAWLGFGKLRLAYGETGQEPEPYLTSTTYSAALLSGITQGTGLSPTQAGLGGLASNLIRGADALKPERTRELEAGLDLGLPGGLADLNLTYYDSRTSDVILLVALPPSSGFTSQAQNAGRFRNRGFEAALNLRPIRRPDLAWEVGLQWSTNRSRVLDLRGSEFVALDGINTITPYGVAREGEPVGVFYDFGLARCGISPTGVGAVIEDVDLATVCAGQPRGALYIGEDGFPVADPNQRVIGDPNPDWTGSVRSSLRLGSWQLSGLLDVRQGGDIYNGTRGALLSYGTHAETAERATFNPATGTYAGNEKVFGRDLLRGPVVGPGANRSVPIGENWYRDGLAPCPFSNVSELCIEDGSYVKLRELALDYTLDAPWVGKRLGLSRIDLRVAGRNLHTWTDYTGYDPETNLGQAIQKTRGMDYFNMPQTRSLVLSATLSR